MCMDAEVGAGGRGCGSQNFPVSLLKDVLFISERNHWPELYKTRNQVIFCDRFGFYFFSVRNVTANLPDSFECFHLSFRSLFNSHPFTWRGVTAEQTLGLKWALMAGITTTPGHYHHSGVLPDTSHRYRQHGCLLVLWTFINSLGNGDHQMKPRKSGVEN